MFPFPPLQLKVNVHGKGSHYCFTKSNHTIKLQVGHNNNINNKNVLVDLLYSHQHIRRNWLT